MTQTDGTFLLGPEWELRFHATGEHRIRYGIRQPERPVGNAAWVVLLGGRTEWIEKYSYVADDLAKAGYRVLAVDHRGQGLSSGLRGHINTYDDFAADLRGIVGDAIPTDANFGILAHSMGGLIALYAALKGWVRPQAVALSSPLLLLPDQPVPKKIAKPLTRFLTRIGLGRVPSGAGSHDRPAFEDNALTHDRLRYERLRKNPYPVPAPTFGWVKATFQAIDYIFSPKNMAALKFPLLLLEAEEETVVDPQGCKIFASSAKTIGIPVESHSITGARHELLSETPPIYSAAMAQYLDFLRKHLQ